MPMRLSVVFAALSLSLPACAQQGVSPFAASGAVPGQGAGYHARGPQLLAQTEGSDPAEVRVAQSQAPSEAVRYPTLPLTREILYKFLLAEIAGQRGNVRLASRAYLELAQSTRDPRFAKRATEVAMYGRFGDIAAEAASVWLEIEPDSQPAKQTLMATMLGGNKLSEAKPLLQKLLAADKVRTGALFQQLNPLLSRHPDRKAALKLVQDLAQPYPRLPDAHLAIAQAAAGAEDFALAESEVGEALALKVDFEPAALFRAHLLQRSSVPEAAAYLKKFVSANPRARDARLFYARLLAADHRPQEARQEFQAIDNEAPGNPEVLVMIGLLSMQLQDLPAAEAKLKKALELNYRDPDTLRFYLGQLAEEGQRPEEALGHYSQVRAGEQAVPAAARHAMLLSRQGRVAEARARLQEVEAQTDPHKALLAQAEAQVLREARQYQEAFDVISTALDGQPDNVDLLYDTAMAAEKVDRIDVLESRLRRVIELRPDHAQAYNALGYTLADRGLRLDEARGYIEKALSLLPDDAFILDSLGWVHYRQGNLDEGLGLLRRAYTRRPDPEIAAHLGEVLWAKGQRADAEALWRTALQEHPANDELQVVIRKFLKQ